MQEKSKSNKKFFSGHRAVFGILGIISTALYIVLKILKVNDLYLINASINVWWLFLMILFDGLFIIFSCFYFAEKKRIHYILTIIFTVFLSLISLFILMLGTNLERSNRYYFTSPNGENKLVVIESGFLSHQYNAYPQKGIFYVNQSNGHLAYDDFSGVMTKDNIIVEWPYQSEAKVKIEHANYRPSFRSNEEDYIAVRFINNLE